MCTNLYARGTQTQCCSGKALIQGEQKVNQRAQRTSNAEIVIQGLNHFAASLECRSSGLTIGKNITALANSTELGRLLSINYRRSLLNKCLDSVYITYLTVLLVYMDFYALTPERYVSLCLVGRIPYTPQCREIAITSIYYTATCCARKLYTIWMVHLRVCVCV